MMDQPEIPQVDDSTLLTRFVEAGDEDAFRALADRYSGLVYGTARRHCFNHQMAEEATQRVFTALARKAKALRAHPTLGGWLFRSAFYEATKAMRAESTRRGKHQQWGELEEIRASPDPTVPPETIAALDEALANLSEKERELVLMRYFRRLSFSQIGERFGISENAGQKRAGRVLEKLARRLERKGIQLGGATMGTVLATGVGESASAAPAGLAATVTQQAVAATGSSASGATLVFGWHAKVAAIVAAGTALVPVGHHWMTSNAHGTDADASTASRVATHGAVASETTDGLATDALFGGTDDPAERMRRILQLEDWDRKRAEIRFLVNELPLADLQIALAVLTERQPEEEGYLSAFIESWVGRQPGTAMKFIGTRSAAYADGYWEALIKAWAEESPEATWKYVSGLPANAEGARRLNAWLSVVCTRDGATALDMLMKAPERMRAKHLEAIFYNWPSDGIGEALDRIAALENSDWKKSALEALCAAPANVLDATWLAEVEDRFGKPMRTSVEESFYAHWFHHDPLAAIDHVRELADPESQGRALERLQYSGMKSHFEEQFALIDDIGDGNWGERQLRLSVMHRWLESAPEAAQAFVMASPPDRQEVYAEAMAAHFSRHEPDKAVAWSRQLGDEKARDAFLGHFLGDLVEQDYDFSLEMMEQIDNEDLIRDLVPQIAVAYARRDPEAAVAWAMEHSAPEQIGVAAKVAMRRWGMSDPEAASAWLAQQENRVVRAASTQGLAHALHQKGETEAAMDLMIAMGTRPGAWGVAESIVSDWILGDARSFLAWVGRQSANVQADIRSLTERWAWLIESEGP